MRLDKWLWAARFYRSRTLAREAIDGGKVQLNGQRARPSQDVTVGAMVALRKGYDDITVEVKGLMEQRGNATIARTLYDETALSIQQRELNAQMRKALKGNRAPEAKPDKKARRDLIGLKRS